jgi:hypothetical protein
MIFTVSALLKYISGIQTTPRKKKNSVGNKVKLCVQVVT